MATFERIHAEIGSAELQPMSWLIVVALACSLALAASMGSNDVANAFGTSVGSGVLTVQKACIIAAIFTFGGAMSLGAEVTKTVAGKVVDVHDFDEEPATYMVGMWCASTSAALCVAFATRFKLPVSTTHAIIGGILGFALVTGHDSILWWPEVGSIFLSWITSPLCAGIISVAIYSATRAFVLTAPSEHALKRQRLWVSLVVAATVFIAVIFIGFREASTHSKWGYGIPLIAMALALLSMGGTYAVLPWYFARKGSGTIENLPLASSSDNPAFDNDGDSDGDSDTETQRGTGTNSGSDSSSSTSTRHSRDSLQTTSRKKHRHAVGSGASYNALSDSVDIALIPSHNQELESNFRAVQVMTACYMSFSHGAGDISNAAGPLLAIWSTYQAGQVVDEIDTIYWIIALSGVGVVVGLVLFGKNVIETVGTDLTEITPSRGYSIELGTAMAVLIASFIGMPISTTHCAVGSVVSLGLVSPSGTKGIQWRLLTKIVISWVLTLPLSGSLSAALFAIFRPLAKISDVPANATLLYCFDNCDNLTVY